MKNLSKKVIVLVLVIAAISAIVTSVSAKGITAEDVADFIIDIDYFTISTLFVKLLTFVVFIFIASMFKLIFTSVKKCIKLNNAMDILAANPCQKTAEAAASEFTNIKKSVRYMLSRGGRKDGVNFEMWREVFNYTVVPCSAIKRETKEALRQALQSVGTFGLRSTYAIQTPQEAKEAIETFSKGGEDNVWHNLKSLQGCDVYRNVRIFNGGTSSEIDAVIVDAEKGIFLIETKSVGGMRTENGNKVIAFDALKEDPSNQIYRHEYDFRTFFADLGIAENIKNVLVFSWPNNEERRVIDKKSFPETDYDIITVEELMRYHRTQSPNQLSEEQRTMLAAKLQSCCKDKIIR